MPKKINFCESQPTLFADFDGCLFDSERAHFQSYLEVLEPHHVSFSQEHFNENYRGLDEATIVDAIRSDFVINLDYAKFRIQRRRIIEKKFGDGEITPFPRVWEFVEKRRASHDIIVISSQQRFLIDMAFARWPLEGLKQILSAPAAGVSKRYLAIEWVQSKDVIIDDDPSFLDHVRRHCLTNQTYLVDSLGNPLSYALKKGDGDA